MQTTAKWDKTMGSKPGSPKCIGDADYTVAESNLPYLLRWSTDFPNALNAGLLPFTFFEKLFYLKSHGMYYIIY